MQIGGSNPAVTRKRIAPVGVQIPPLAPPSRYRQVGRQRFHKPLIDGSIPSIANNGMWPSLVGRFVRDEEVAGSNPVIPMSRAAWSDHGESHKLLKRSATLRSAPIYPRSLMDRRRFPKSEHASSILAVGSRACVSGSRSIF